MICHKRPRKTGSFTVEQDTAESIQKIITIDIIEKNLSPINPPDNDMVQRSRGVYAGFSGHVNHLSNKSEYVNRKSEERPQLLPHRQGSSFKKPFGNRNNRYLKIFSINGFLLIEGQYRAFVQTEMLHPLFQRSDFPFPCVFKGHIITNLDQL